MDLEIFAQEEQREAEIWTQNSLCKTQTEKKKLDLV